MDADPSPADPPEREGTRTDPGQPARRYYGLWMVPIAVLAMICTLPAQTILVSQFNTPIREALGLSLNQISLAYLIGTSLAALPLTLVGQAADRFGLRVVLGWVVVAFALALGLLGQVSGIVSLTLGFASIRFLGQGSLGMLASHTLAMWFERRLGVMESAKHIGFSLGALVLPALTVALIEAVGWRSALALLGASVAALLLPLVATVFRNRPEDVGQHLDGDPPPRAADPSLVDAAREDNSTPSPERPLPEVAFTLAEALRTRALWILLCSGPFLGMVGTAMLFHTQPILASFGVEDTAAAAPSVQAPWALALALTPFVSGWLVDTFHPRWLLAAGLALAGVSCACMALGGQEALGWSAVVWMGVGMGVFGVAGGLIMSVSGPTLARYYGRTHHGSIRGITITVAVAATATGPYLLSEGADLAGGRFDWVLLAFALSALPLILAALTLRKPEPARRLAPSA